MRATDEEIKHLGPWFHNLHLPDGTQTAPEHSLGDFPMYKWQEIEPYIPKNLNGLQVLDIGCNAGFYSIELALRGADVTAIDMDEHYLRQAKWAVRKFNLEEKIRFYQMQIYSLAHQNKMYDLVWFMGVFYHLRYPMLALDIISRISSNMMVFQTLTIPDKETYPNVKDIDLFSREVMIRNGWPRMAFIEHKLDGDPTNWWAPNHSAIEAMLRASGFKVHKRPSRETYICLRTGEKICCEDIREMEYRAATNSEKE
ncbi:Methyltransferase type 11 [Chitinispirillum alkaliphilum]|nr:Methyltransferase type 11 [Chitinispirillum alkaliphilum]